MADPRGALARQTEVYLAGVSGTRPRVPVGAEALERAASEVMDPEAFAYVAGGAGGESTVRENRAVQQFVGTYSRPSLTWDDLPFLRERTRLPILLKGVLHPDDARRAVDAGMDGIVSPTTADGRWTGPSPPSTPSPAWWRRSGRAFRC